MTPVGKSLAYDAVVLVLAVVVVRNSSGLVETGAFAVGFATLASAPFDVWRHGRTESRGE